MSQKENQHHVDLENTDISLSVFRLIRPGQIKQMALSLERIGQLHDVIMRHHEGVYQLLDGFKRYYAAEQLGWISLSARVLETSEASGKAMMLSYNQESGSLVDFEEALILYSLKHDHLLQQIEISGLVGRSRSWVCRRLSLIERLDENVQAQLRMGNLTPAHAREIMKLQRCNQPEMAQAIIGHNVTSRQSAWLVEKYLKSGSKAEREYLLQSPMEAIANAEKERDIYDSRLGRHGNRLLKTIEILLLQEHILIGQYTDRETGCLSGVEWSVLTPKLKQVIEKGNTIRQFITNKSK